MARNNRYNSIVGRTNALKYMANVGKSLGYSFADNFTSMNPTVSALFAQSKELKEDLFHSISDFKAKATNFDSDSTAGKIKDTVKDIRTNLFNDLRTGNWYNKERKDKYETEAGGAMLGIDFDDFGDFDDDFGDLDFDDSFGDELSAEAKLEENNAKAISGSVEDAAYRSSSAISTATVRSADYIVESARANTEALYSMTSEGFGKMAVGMAAINSNISTIVALGQPLTEHMQNSSLFFTKSTEYQEKALKLLEQIAANTAPASSSNKYGSRNNKLTLSSMMDSNGLIDLSSYKEFVKKNVKDQFSLVTSMLDMFGGWENAVKMMSGSPLALFLPMLTGSLFNVKGTRTGKTMKGSMENFNKALSGLMSGGMAKLRSAKFDNTTFFGGILNTLRNILVPKSGLQKNPSLSNYEKGKVDWDGKSRRALIDVIPTQLGKILSALTGEDEYRYNYDTGRWMSRKDLKKQRHERDERFARSAGGDFFSDIKRSVRYDSTMSKTKKAEYEHEIDRFLYQLLMRDNEDFLNFMDGNFDGKKYEIFKKHPEMAKDLQKRARAIARRNPVALAQLAQNMYEARGRKGSYMSNISEEELALYNNSNFGKVKNIKSSMLSPGSNIFMDLTDQYGNNVFYYLQGIYSSTGKVANNLKYLINGKGGRKGRGTTNIKLEDGPNFHRSESQNTTKVSNNVTQKEEETETPKKDPQRTFYGNDISLNKALNKVYGDNDIPYLKYIESSVKDKVEDYIRKGKTGTNEEYDDIIKVAQAKYESGQKVGGAVSNIYRNISDSFAGAPLKAMEKMLSSTTDGVATVLDGITQKMNEMIYKTGEDGSSLMSTIKLGLKDIFGGIFGGFSALIPTWVKKFASDIWNSDWVKSLRSSIKQSFGEIFGGLFGGLFGNKKKNEQPETPTTAEVLREARYENATTDEELDIAYEEENMMEASAHGSGIIKRIIEESNKASNNSYWKYSGNGAGYSGLLTNSTVNYPVRTRSRARSRRRQGAGASGTNDKASSDDAAAAAQDNVAKDIVITAASEVKDWIVSGLVNVFGSNKEEDEKKALEDNIQSVMQDLGLNKGAIGAGAIIGGGVSLLTGAFIGPIAGAGIGAAIGFVSKSKTAQDLLFGKEDENGEYKKGLLPKKVSDVIKKYTPSMGKGAGIGGIIGTLTGSPIMGAIIGASVGFVKSSDKAKNFLFGEIDEETKERKGGLISKEVQDRLKEAAGPTITGGVLGLLAGPFGLFGNIVFGSALGFLSSSESFRKYLFGEKDNDGKRKGGGLVDKIKDKLFNKIEEYSVNLWNATKGFLVNLGASIKDATLKLFSKDGFLGKMVGGALGLVVGAVKKIPGVGEFLTSGAVDLLAHPVNFLNERRKTRNLDKGYQVYDRALGRNLTAAERVKARGKNSGRLSTFDKALADTFDKGGTTGVAEMITELQGGFASEEAFEALKDKYHFKKKSDLRNALRLAKDEKGIDSEQRKQELQWQKEDSFRVKLGNMLVNISNKLSKGFGLPVDEEEVEGEKVEGVSKTATEAVNEAAAAVAPTTGKFSFLSKVEGLTEREKVLGKSESSDESGENGVTTDQYGNKVEDLGETGVRDKIKKETTVLSGFASIPFIRSGVSKLSDTIGKMGKALLGEEKKEPSFFDKLKDLFFNSEDGLFKGFVSLFTGGSGKGAIGKILSGINLPSILATGLGIVGLGATIETLFGDESTSPLIKAINKIAAKLGPKDESGDASFNNSETVINGSTVGANDTAVSQIRENFVSGTLTGKGSVAGLAAAKSVSLVTKGKVKLPINGKEAAKMATKASSKAFQEGIREYCLKAFSNLPEIFKKVPFIGNRLYEVAEEFTSNLWVHLDDALEHAPFEKLGKIANWVGDAFILVQIAYSIGRAVDAYGNAGSILGITKEPTTGQRAIAVVLATVNSLIPYIGDLIPDSTIVNIFMSAAKKFGWDVGNLEEDREAAAEEILFAEQKFGTDLDIQSYNEAGYEAVRDENGKIVDIKQGASRAGVLTQAFHGVKDLVSQAGESLRSTVNNGSFDFKEDVISPIFTSALNGIKQLGTFFIKGDVKGLIEEPVPTDGLDPNNGIHNVIGAVISTLFAGVKVGFIPITAVSFAYNSVFKFVGGIIDKVKSGVSKFTNVIKTSFSTGSELMSEGTNLKELLDVSDLEDSENPMNGFLKATAIVSRLAVLPAVAIKFVSLKISNALNPYTDPIGEDFSALKETGNAMKSASDNGDIVSIITQKAPTFTSVVGGFFSPIFNIQKAFYTVSGAIKYIGKSLAEGKKSTEEKIGTDVSNLEKALADMSEKAVDGDFKGIKSVTFEPTTPFIGGFLKKAFQIAKLFNYATATASLAGNVVKKGKEAVSEGIEQVKEKGKNVVEKGKNAVENVVEKGKGALEKGANFLFGGFQDMAQYNTEQTGSATGSGLSGGASGFQSQLDSKYSNMRVGGMSMADNGCGPASAVMALNAVGKNSSMRNAVSVANNYQTAGGTDISYFGDMFNRSGMDASYLSGSGVGQAIASGHPVVLMGQDTRNRSKSNSPFGPRNHYVVANGIDGNGNIRISDPENRGVKSYSPKILNNVKMGVAASGSTYRFRSNPLFGIGAGASYSDSSKEAQTWAFFKSKGCSDIVTAAIMGNIQGESGFNLGALGDNGTSYGLCQWHNDRWTALKDFCSANGFSSDSLQGQLEFLWYELNTTEKRFFEAIGGPSYDGDLVTAVREFVKKFERPKDPTAATNKRSPYAQTFYQAFTGKTIPLNLSSSGSSSSMYPDGAAKQQQMVDLLRSKLGALTYSMKSPRNPEQGSADCSSTVNWAYKKVFGVDIGNSTQAMLSNPNTQVVYQDPNIDSVKGGTNSNGPDESKLQPGDILLYSRPKGSYTEGRPYRVGHVEMYAGNGKRIGHGGSGKGPKETPLSSGANSFIMAKRLVGLDGADGTSGGFDNSSFSNETSNTNSSSSTSSGNILSRIASVFAKGFGKLFGDSSAEGSGLLKYNSSDAGRRLLLSNSDMFSGGDSGLNNSEFRPVKANTPAYNGRSINYNARSSSARVGAGDSGISKETALMLKTIITLIEQLVANTDKVNNIYDILKEYCNASNNPELIKAASSLSDTSAKGSGNNAFSSSYIPRKSNTQVTLDALSDLKGVCDRILAG